MLLETLLLPVHEITDFTKLPIPFKCIATNIETGNAMVLDHGNLAISVRASMAIPSIFNPVEIRDTLLVDGGIVRNFPVTDAKEMGADIVIGVNVGGPLYKKDQLNSMFAIIQQAVNFRDYIVDRQQEELCDILITPDIQGIDASSFNLTDSIIVHGKNAAIKAYPQLKALADSLKQYSDSKKTIRKPRSEKKFLITKIEIIGNKIIHDKKIRQKIYIEENDWVTAEGINKNIENIFSTRFFKNVYYQLITDKSGHGNTLKIKVVEADINRIKLGVHYDNDLKSALLLNYTNRNFLFSGSKFTIDGRFSQNPAIRFAYFYYTGYRPDIGLGLAAGFSDLNIAEYRFDNQRIGTDKFLLYYASVLLNMIVKPSMAITGGIRYEYSNMNVNDMIGASYFDLPCELPLRVGLKEKISMFNLYGIYNFDTMNSRYFTKTGSKVRFKLSYIPKINNSDLEILLYTDLENPVKPSEDYRNIYKSFVQFNGKVQHSVTLDKWFTMTGQIRGGFSNKNNIPLHNYFLLGGISREKRNTIPFMGARLLEYANTNFLSGLISFQAEPMTDKFIVLTGNAGYLTDNYEDFLKMSIADENFIYGYGLTLGMKSIIGPLSVTFMTKDNLKNMLTYFNIGYYF